MKGQENIEKPSLTAEKILFWAFFEREKGEMSKGKGKEKKIFVSPLRR